MAGSTHETLLSRPPRSARSALLRLCQSVVSSVDDPKTKDPYESPFMHSGPKGPSPIRFNNLPKVTAPDQKIAPTTPRPHTFTFRRTSPHRFSALYALSRY